MAVEKIYIAGPMSGLPDLNFPAFHAAERRLALRGYFVVNPANLQETGKDWAYYMRKDLREMLRCDAIYLLAGWQKSKGASLERHVAQALGMAVLYEEREQ